MNIVKVISTEFTDLSQRLVKFLRLGKSDVRTAIEAGPFGVDSNAPKDTVAAYSDTAVKGQSVIVGYVNTRQHAGVGEVRTYSVDSSGSIVFYTWMFADGTMEIGGNTDNMVRYVPVADSVNELKDSVNDLKNIFTSWTPVPNDGGAALKAGVTTWASTPLIEDITAAKINEIKTL